MILDGSLLTDMLPLMVERTGRCSVEQLEQVNSALMDYVWRTRGDWNRTKVAAAALKLFNETLAEVQREAALELVPVGGE